MEAAISEPRAEMSPYAPRIYTVTVPTDKIREIIGPGGKVIRGITDATGVKIDIHDDGTVNIFAIRRRFGQEGPADDHRHRRRCRSRQNLSRQSRPHR